MTRSDLSFPSRPVRSVLPMLLALLPVMTACESRAPSVEADAAIGSASASGSAESVVLNLRRTVGIAHEKLVSLAEAMPEEDYSWRPMEGVRSVGDVFIHVAADNWFGPALMGIEAPPETGVTTEDETVRAYQERDLSKEEILAEMEASFQHILAAMDQVAPQAGEEVSLRGNAMSQADLWVRLVVHMHEHLGQAVAYARSREVVPPWSR